VQKYKAIIADIDGTLTVSSLNALPSQKVKDAIRQATEKGVLFSVASARPYNLLSFLIDDVPLRSPIIINNGAEIYDTRIKKPIWESTIPFETAQKILEIAKQYKSYHLDLAREELISSSSITKDTKVFKFVIFGLTNDEVEHLITSTQKDFPMVNCSKGGSYMGKGFFDVYIANSDATKQHAVLKFAELLNISTQEIIGIGDHYNDFPLLMACGLKVAMGNAVDDLKAIADYIAPNVEEDGVADVIQKFVLNE